ncbi:MAG: UDP-N-acetylmuramoyl-L-alanyl-D-glutamate--2,6-diaminopimelate ligase [Candidatus Latescibacteria bacterium]|nr:UDP-N-acetylmuramoyl-L-alanyl-D-glutamate--2,6-diaminopimelate ligase [Candidatus Latescibacterota bacterium]
MRLVDFICRIPGAQWLHPGNPRVTGLATDSRRVEPGDLFVAIRGGQLEDRHRFVPQAIAAGAVAVVVEEPVQADVAVVRVPSTRKALGVFAEHYYESPSRKLRMVGVTGTNGKTTTAMLIQASLAAAVGDCGLLGTVEYRLGGRRMPSVIGTPEAHDLQRLLREMTDSGCTAAVMEVTSHGLALDRVQGIAFDAAVFTNFSRDHLDFHGSLESYLAAKKLLFDNLIPNALAVVNADDEATDRLLSNCSARAVSYGRSPSADVRIAKAETDGRGTRMDLETPWGSLQLTLALQGRFHQMNAAAAIAAGLAMDVDAETIAVAIRDVQVPGRFESIQEGQNFSVIVDYAHTPDALGNVLRAAREFTEGRLICVFGCGGDRDRGKRPQMGRISARMSDLTVVTSDNPRTEDPDSILRDVVAGVGGADHLVEVDRRKAISLAIENAAGGDLVVIAGKGHEDYQDVGGQKIHFDDRQVARDVLSGRE